MDQAASLMRAVGKEIARRPSITSTEIAGKLRAEHAGVVNVMRHLGAAWGFRIVEPAGSTHVAVVENDVSAAFKRAFE